MRVKKAVLSIAAVSDTRQQKNQKSYYERSEKEKAQNEEMYIF